MDVNDNFELEAGSIEPEEEAAANAEAEIRLGIETRDPGRDLNTACNERTLLNLCFSGFETLLQMIIPGFRTKIDYNFSDEEIDSLAIFQSVDLQEPGFKDKFPYWHALLNDGDNFVWEQRCEELLGSIGLSHPLISQMDTFRSKLRAYLGSWNASSEHCSSNIYVLENSIVAHRIPSVNQTDSIRGKLGFNRGVHAWEMVIYGPVGTHFSVGIATSQAELWTKAGYTSMIGDNVNSWGWDIVWGNISHGGSIDRYYPENFVYVYTPGDTIQIILDCERGTLSYAVNEFSLGQAFENLPRKTFYPSMALVYGNTEVSLIYLGEPPSLKETCYTKLEECEERANYCCPND